MISTHKFVKQGIRQKLAVAIAGATLALTSFGIFSHSAKAGSFSLTCKEVYLSDGIILGAKCADNRGGYKDTFINLNTVIGNSNGNLIWENTNFSKSCRKIQLVCKNLLFAQCADVNGIFFYTTIDIDQRLKNRRGKLQLD